jgi:hypothetical protein
VVWSGRVDLAAWQKHFERLIADTQFPPGPRWLVDLRATSVDLLDETAIASMGAQMSEAADLLRGIRLAVVTVGARAKVSRLFDHELAIEGLTTTQFDAVDAACIWLGVAIGDARRILDELRWAVETN